MIALILGMMLATPQQNVEELPNSCMRFFSSAGPTDRDLNGKNTHPMTLPKADIDKAINQRACMMSFPWPSHPSWPKGKDYHGELATSADMRRVRDSLLSYRDGTRDTKDETHLELQFHERFQHHSPDITQHILFADVILLKKLKAEGRFQEAAEEAQRIVSSEQIHSKLTQWTVLDENTYLSIQNLKNLLLVEAAALHEHLPVKSPAEELKFVVSFLDQRPGLKDTFGRLGTVDPTVPLLRRIMNEDWYSLNDPSWIRSEQLARIPFLEGASKSNGELLVILRSRRLYSIAVDETGTHLLSGSAAASAYTRVLQADVDAGSSKDMRLFAVSKFGQDYQISVGGQGPIDLTAHDLTILKTGKVLASDHPLTKLVAHEVQGSVPLVLYTNPLLLRNREQSDSADDVAFSIQKSYPEVGIVRDPLSEHTSTQVRELSGMTLASPASVIAVVAPDSFEVKDYKLVQNLEDDLRAKGIEVVEFAKGQIQWTQVQGKTVLVVTGHIDSKLAAFVRALGEANVFRDNYIIFNSCRAELNRVLATEMTTKFGAAAVYSYDSAIRPEELEPLLMHIPEVPSSEPFADRWRKLVKESSLNGIWTVCTNSSGNSASGIFV